MSQVLAAHWTVVPYERHFPLPSHVPSRPQFDGGRSGPQLPRVGAEPAATGTQCPRLPAWLQNAQGPSQALSQQTLSAQKPLAQSLAATHSCPTANISDAP